MNAELQCLYLCVLSCFFVTTQSKPGKVLPPQNVSAVWDSDFHPGLSWCPPLHSGTNCSYQVSAKTKSSSVANKVTETSVNISLLVMEGGSILWNVNTLCQGSASKPVVLNISYPELVKDLDCYLYSPRNARCQWSPVRQPPDFGFHYKLVNEYSGDSGPFVSRECSSYSLSDGVKSGCELQATIHHDVYIVFKGTVNNTLVRNTFKRRLIDAVRPPPLDWTVTKSDQKFNISWNPPDITDSNGLEIEINYTECGVTHEPVGIKNQMSYLLDRNSHCRYSIAVRAKSGDTSWGDWKHFDGDADVSLKAVLFSIPVMLAALVALSCVCFQKNKATICPNVPEPVDYLSEISNNNNTKSIFHNIYTLVKEEECKISVVAALQLNRANCLHPSNLTSNQEEGK